MTNLRTLQEDLDEFEAFLETLPHPPGEDVSALVKAFRSAAQPERVGKNAEPRGVYTPPKTVRR